MQYSMQYTVQYSLSESSKLRGKAFLHLIEFIVTDNYQNFTVVEKSDFSIYCYQIIHRHK